MAKLVTFFIPENTNDISSLRETLTSFTPFNDQEVRDKATIVQALNTITNPFDRNPFAHITCSAWTVDPLGESTLLVYHRLYHSWSWIGGHADGSGRPEQTAWRELQEETGITSAQLFMGTADRHIAPRKLSAATKCTQQTRLLSSGIFLPLESAMPPQLPRQPIAPFSLEVLSVAGHVKGSNYVGSHLHLNLTYLFVAQPSQPLRIQPAENTALRWVALKHVCSLSNEPWMCVHIYPKLIAKVASLTDSSFTLG